ncbi:MAG: EAL domain-containing protein [Leptospiraceae bacterium]|nr:EAL domain-containing protein [Leptospiraceae bacterium]
MEGNIKVKNYRKISCAECLEGKVLPFQFSMAFQPIVDSNSKTLFSTEALVRGINGESAQFILSKVNDENRYQFDQACRVKAIELASKLKLQSFLNINFLPNAVYRPETCIAATLEASEKFSFPIDRLIFEITEGEKITDHDHVISIFKEYKKQGMKTAIDDFGAGYSGLNLLAKFQPDYIKLDMEIIRDIHKDKIRRAIVKSIISVCEEIGIIVKAEGIETIEEYNCLRELGIYLFQGYYFARPSFESLAEVSAEKF